MKRFLTPTWITAWFMGLLPNGVFGLGKKTPWYRRIPTAYAPWVGGALMAPFAIFLAWKGVSLLRGKQSQAQK